MDYLSRSNGYFDSIIGRHAIHEFKVKNHVLDKNHALNEYCPQEQKALMVENMTCIHYRKGEIIFHEGQPSYLIYLVDTGVIKLWKEGHHKKGQITRFAKQGDMIGFWGSLENSTYTLTASCITDADLYCIKKDTFFPIIQSGSVMHAILHDYIKELKKMEDFIRNMAEMNIKEKVANALLILLDVFKEQPDKESFKFILSRKEITALSAVCEDRVSKQLTEFKNEGVIIINDNGTIINRRVLEKIVEPYLLGERLQ